VTFPVLDDPNPLSLLPRAIAAHTGGPAPSYARTYLAAVGGKFPAQWKNGRWWWWQADLPLAADALGTSRQWQRRAWPRSAEAPLET
jgi:hypothetical protein